jgi:hypothetical protein
MISDSSRRDSPQGRRVRPSLGVRRLLRLDGSPSGIYSTMSSDATRRSNRSSVRDLVKVGVTRGLLSGHMISGRSCSIES